MILSCFSRATQPACLVTQDHTSRGGGPAAANSRCRRVAVGDLVSLTQDKNLQRAIGERWSRICVGVFSYGGSASLLELLLVVDGQQ